ncbi:MAG: hypothetical protein P8Q36_13590 [Alphaproteobacteria bacterium]|jgi:hypothetical protein|nr:hypothetical protein [Rhodospirillaceae bacterium]MBT6511173.1 hypothetical protein [Rhodospirillaceae bacterium]MBT7614409.1 hypothetical protein [Rhodospirillaceae bacterium]MBT7646746.1 hypothetical protein [Rhodospirillaceae bacterium]MDG2481879.1 hypothetical protein [Alphaproteobacteria bacterium]
MIIFPKTTFALALACVLASPLAAQDEAIDTLTGDEVTAAIAGSTLLVTVMGGDQFREYFAPDGSITMTGNYGAYDGTWWIEDDTICMELVFPSNDDCWSVALEGDAITLIGADGRIDYEKKIITRSDPATE